MDLGYEPLPYGNDLWVKLADYEASQAALARAEQALAEESKWKTWAETVEGLIVHRLETHDLFDSKCEDCQTISAIFESSEPLAAATTTQPPAASSSEGGR